MSSATVLVRKGLFFLRTRGARQTAIRVAQRVQRKRSEKRYVRDLARPEETLAAQRAESAGWEPAFSVIVPLYNTPLNLLEETVRSVIRQSYVKWELCLADGSDGQHGEVRETCERLAAEEPRIRYRKLEKNLGISGNTNAALEMATGDYIALFDHDDLLQPDALYEMARAIRDQGADFLYSDEMIFRSPRITRIVGIRFKQDFMPEDLLTNNYICHLTVFRKDLLRKAGAFRSEYDGSQDHDLVLRLTAAAEKPVHVPKVLYLWRSIPGSTAADVHMKEYAIDAGRRAVADFLRTHGRPEARVESSEVFPTMYRITEPIRGNPSVRVILSVSEKDGDAEAKLRRMKENTGWENCVWQPLRMEDAGFPGALKDAVSAAREDYLLFVNGIPDPQNPDWLREMLMQAKGEKIGAVGAKVLFENGRDLRHAGIILGLGQNGIAGRPYFDRFDDGVGFFGQLAVVRTVSAVTDCWIVSREKLAAAGGPDENYTGSLRDIDLCLKLRERGYRNLWTPYARMCGGKAKDFRMDVGMEEAGYEEDCAVFRRKWEKTLRQGDPCYNRNLSLRHEDWRLP